ncbi:redox-sensitive bicupin YhaK (pirin superfamily) [Variovorax boronicumulans]|uniref:Redox-sensitive bicupin YhaK (Pirin superfamily) n=1 Tax=Variovorax boronicumulans TaxID=436515 RepID=A0AAW8CTA3_9BURK|nr:redox-sensitive bicupin YhaK (pirin superfamily) [Variovorax boronicumulans]MDQ0053341.1 redox-sensitive bicupin YhaK (pirin superfamily) [Variovorax boronicumulans]
MTAAAVATETRAIVYRTRGAQHGPITRLMSPGDLGEFLKPFVFLDLFGFDVGGGHKGFGMHPHSGIATLTWLIDGDTLYEDTTGDRACCTAAASSGCARATACGTPARPRRA